MTSTHHAPFLAATTSTGRRRLAASMAVSTAASLILSLTLVVFPGARPVDAAATASFERVSVANDGGPSIGQYGWQPTTMSDDGRYVSFRSDSTTLVPGDTNAQTDLFVRDHVNGTTERVNITDAGVPDDGGSYSSRISANGRQVVFLSYSAMVVAFTNTNTDSRGAFDPNRNVDTYLRDLDSGVTEQISVGPAGRQGNSSAGGGVDVSAGVTELALLPGDRIAVVTDGMLERRASQVDLPVEMVGTRALHPREATRTLADKVIEAAGPTLEDDATLLILDWNSDHDQERITDAGADSRQ